MVVWLSVRRMKGDSESRPLEDQKIIVAYTPEPQNTAFLDALTSEPAVSCVRVEDQCVHFEERDARRAAQEEFVKIVRARRRRTDRK